MFQLAFKKRVEEKFILKVLVEKFKWSLLLKLSKKKKK